MPGSPGQGAVYHWWEQPFANDFGGPEPYGNFPKPDLNVQVPYGMPIANITPGTVTNVDQSDPWGYTVTIKLDQPVNNLATHAAYLHMAVVNVFVGQHVGLYDQLGYAGPPQPLGSFQNAPLGFAFYPGDWYGKGPAWNQYFASSSTPDLNPYNWLRKFGGQTTGRTITQPNAPTTDLLGNTIGGANVVNNKCAAWDIGCILANIGKDLPRIGEGILGGLLILIAVIMGVLSLMDKSPMDVLSLYKRPIPKPPMKAPKP